MIDFKIMNCKDKLSKLSKDESLKIIYGWIKQNHITLKQFKELVSFSMLSENSNNEKTSDKNYYNDLE